MNNVSFTTLPVQRRYGGRTKSKEEANVIHETDSGQRFTYNQFTRDVYEFTFMCTLTQLAGFEALHDAAAGEVNEFYYSITGVGAADSIHVNKEAGFDPIEEDQAISGVRFFTYTLKLKTVAA